MTHHHTPPKRLRIKASTWTDKARRFVSHTAKRGVGDHRTLLLLAKHFGIETTREELREIRRARR